MKSVEFCYWLQGMFEINPPSVGLSKEQVSIIKKHLDMVFYHEIDNSYPSEQQDALNKFHNEIKQPVEVKQEVKQEVKPQYIPNVGEKEEHVIYPTSITPSNLSGIDVIPSSKPKPPLTYDPTLLRC